MVDRPWDSPLIVSIKVIIVTLNSYEDLVMCMHLPTLKSSSQSLLYVITMERWDRSSHRVILEVYEASYYRYMHMVSIYALIISQGVYGWPDL